MIMANEVADSIRKAQSADMMISINKLKNPWWKSILIWFRLMKDPLTKGHTFKVQKNRYRDTFMMTGKIIYKGNK